MKKLLSLLLVMTLILSLGMGAFAVAGDTPVAGSDDAENPYGYQDDADWTSVKFKKSITTIGNEGALHPAETFNFTITPVSAVDEQGNSIATIPAFSPATFNISVAEDDGEAIATVNLPTYTKVGTYVYNVVETASNTAGMVYDTTEYEFTVIVLNDGVNNEGVRQLKRLVLLKNVGDDEPGQKTDVFNNGYKAGSLVVNKEITGNNANFAETFPVKVTLTPEVGKTINSTILGFGPDAANIVVGAADTNGVIEVTFDVTNGSQVTIKNIPYGTNYVVEEVEVVDGKIKGYTPTYDNNKTGTIGAASITTDIENNLSVDIATGISLDNIPYILLLAGAAIGIVALIVRKRKNFEY